MTTTYALRSLVLAGLMNGCAASIGENRGDALTSNDALIPQDASVDRPPLRDVPTVDVFCPPVSECDVNLLRRIQMADTFRDLPAGAAERSLRERFPGIPRELSPIVAGLTNLGVGCERIRSGLWRFDQVESWATIDGPLGTSVIIGGHGHALEDARCLSEWAMATFLIHPDGQAERIVLGHIGGPLATPTIPIFPDGGSPEPANVFYFSEIPCYPLIPSPDGRMVPLDGSLYVYETPLGRPQRLFRFGLRSTAEGPIIFDFNAARDVCRQ